MNAICDPLSTDSQESGFDSFSAALDVLTTIKPLATLLDTGQDETTMTWRTASMTRARMQAGGPPVNYTATSQDCVRLRDFLLGRIPLMEIQTPSLVLKRLVCGNGVTEYGMASAITALSLREQCQLLRIPLTETPHPLGELRPERHMLNALLAKEPTASGLFTEGRSITFAVMAAGASLLWPLVQDYLGQRDAESSFRMLWTPPAAQYVDAVASEIRSATRKDVENGFEFILACQFDASLRWLGIDQIPTSHIGRIFDATGGELLAKAFRMIAIDSFAFSWGWPDLDIVDDTHLRLVEVKTRDRLHLSQVVTLPALMALGFDVSVVRATKGRSTGRRESS